MPMPEMAQVPLVVAPLAGSVDRNAMRRVLPPLVKVAPLAGSVDRNLEGKIDVAPLSGRSPHGERG